MHYYSNEFLEVKKYQVYPTLWAYIQFQLS